MLQEVGDRFKLTLPGKLSFNAKTSPKFSLFHEQSPSGEHHVLNEGEIWVQTPHRNEVIGKLVSQVRLLVAEHAVDRIFIHAGCVAIRDKAIIIPGRSFSGKSSLTAELVKLGARFHSDEYAILDSEGFVYPVSRFMSVRDPDGLIQTEHDIEQYGAKRAVRKTRVKLVVLTKYRQGSRWRPERISAPRGILETIKHVIPIRQNPEAALSALSAVAADAQFLKSHRGDAKLCAKELISEVEKIS